MVRASLNLVGDEGLEDILEAVFDLRFTDDELRSMTTVGAIHDVINARLPARPGACETSMAFYRLRRGLIGMGATGRIRPTTPLPEVFSRQAKKSFRALAKASGLKLPSADGGPLALAAFLIAAAAAVLFLIGFVTHSGLFALLGGAACVGSIVCGRADAGRLPKSLGTAGDLSRRVAPLNFGRLAAQGARVTSEQTWAVLCDEIAYTADIPRGEIGRETLIYSPKKAAA